MSRAVRIERGGRTETVDLDEFGAGAIAERAAETANAWIKSLRGLEVGGQPLRDRFTCRGDSLWWFAELYLHRQGVVTALAQAALALDALCAQASPAAIGTAGGDRVLAHLLPQIAARYGIAVLPAPAAPDAHARLRTGVRSRLYTWAAMASHRLPARTPAIRRGGTLAFVHSAFWRPQRAEADRSPEAGARAEVRAADWKGEEGYIGPVLDALAGSRAAPVQLVGVGPRRNFRARRWWHTLQPSWRAPTGGGAVVPVERFAAGNGLRESRAIWRARHAIARELRSSGALRDAARIAGCDVWPVVAEELSGVATLQFPWSVRAMDEAGAALDACRPRLALTYAEAGGWGRAIMLEARRRGIPSAGLQHGFIYRHWLNYRHEPDEMRPSPGNPADRGFPRPDLTLVYDGYAADHLRRAGSFPDGVIAVTGSPALDRLAAALGALGPEGRARVRAELGVAAGDAVALLVAKRAQLGRWLEAIAEAVRRQRGVWLIIKPHPAETAAAYDAAAPGAERVLLAPPQLGLPGLLAAADLVVTVNSTVAIDGSVLGVPALAVALPNNLSPFVERGMMAGVADVPALPARLAGALADPAVRAGLQAESRRFAEACGIRPDGASASRAAAALERLAAGSGPQAGRLL